MEKVNILTQYIEEHQEELYAFVLHYMKNSDLAYDAYQEAVIKAITHFSSLRHQRYMKTWLYRIMINECKNQLKAYQTYELIDENMGDPRDEMLKQKVLSAIDDLEEPYHDIVYLKYCGWNFREISKILKMRQGTCKSRYYKALSILKENWKGESIDG